MMPQITCGSGQRHPDMDSFTRDIRILSDPGHYDLFVGENLS